MIHFNRKTEYALLAIEHMSQKSDLLGSITSTREIADAYQIPYPLLAKIMQKLSSKGIIKSLQGTKGGYILNRKPADISVANIVEIFEGKVAVAECFKEEKVTCPQWSGCNIRDPFYELNLKIHRLLEETSIEDLARKRETASTQSSRPQGITL